MLVEPEVLIHIDGASRGNPGDASYGFAVLNTHRKIVYRESGYIGKTTNNVAEYTALIKALEWLLNRGVQRAEIRSDSELLVKQIRGEYKVRSIHLQSLYLQCRSLLSRFSLIRVIHVPRKENRIADRLANEALDRLQKPATEIG